MSSEFAIGIDLGTTFSVIAACHDGKVEVMQIDSGNRIVPSVVAFTNTERLVGETAVYQADENPENTVYCVKRLMGRSRDDKEIQNDLKHWPFKVIEDNGDVKVEVEYKGKTTKFLPEQISSMILEKLKETAETNLNTIITKAVITVPAYFNKAQREATIDAAKLVGLNVLQIINEPTAAAISFGLKAKSGKPLTVLVYDFGGGTFDVSIIKIEDKDLKVLAVTGDIHLGGEDINTLLVEYFVEKFKNDGQDISNDKSLVQNLRTKCEQLKIKLSFAHEGTVKIDGTSLTALLTRARFEDINYDIFERTIELIKEVLNHAKLEKKDIDQIVMVGGSSRIPRVQELVTEFFDGKALNKNLNPDESVAIGAAILAGSLCGDTSSLPAMMKVHDVNPLSVDNALYDGSMEVLTRQNSRIRFKMNKLFRAAREESTEIEVEMNKKHCQEKMKALNDLLSYCFKLKEDTKKSNIRNEDKIEITKECERILTWVDNNKGASKEDFLQKYEDLKSFNENRNQSENKPQSNENQPSSNENLYPKQNRDLTKRNAKKNSDDSNLEKQKMTNIENLIKQSDYNGALKELNRIIRRLNENLDDENFILFSYTKRAEVYQLMDLNGKALLDYNHLLDSNRFSTERKKIEIKRDVIESDLVKHEILTSIERCRKIAQIGSHKASEIDREIEKLLTKTNFEKYKQQKGDIYYEHAKIHFNFKNYSKTIDLANMALQNQSGKDDLYDIIGQSYFNLDDFEQAKSNFEKVHYMNPTKDSREKIDKCKIGIRSNEIKNKLKAVETLLKQKEYEKSLSTLKNINLDHITDDCVTFDILYKKCLTLFGCKMYEEALIQCNKTLIQVKKMRPEDRSQFDVKVQEMQDKRNEIEMEIVKKDITETIRRCKEFAKLGIHQTSKIDREIESLLSKVNVDKFKHFKGDIYYEHAKIHFNFQNYQNTIDLANNALQNNLKNTDLYDMIGQSYYNLNNFEQAKVNFELAYKLNNSKGLKDKIEKCIIAITRNLLRVCDELCWQQKYDVSLKMLETINLRGIPDIELNFDVFYLKVFALLGCNKHEDALKQCNEALKLNSSKFTKVEEIKIKRDEINRELVGNKITRTIEKCIQLAQNGNQKSSQIDNEIKKLVISLSKADLEINKGYIYFSHANIYFNFKEYKQAIELAKMGMGNHEGDKILLDMIGNCYVNLGEFEKAKESFEAANQLCYSEILRDKIEKCNKESRTAEFKRNLKYCQELCQRQKYDESLKVLESIDLSHIPHGKLQFDVLFQKSVTLFGCKMYEDAVNQSNEALQLIKKMTKIGVASDNIKTLKQKSQLNFIMGECYFYQNYFEKAKTVFKEAQLQENSKVIAEYVEKCNQQLFLGEVIQQLEVSNNFYIQKNFENALDALKNFDTYQIADFNLKIKILYERARCNYSLEKYSIALRHCEKAINMLNLKVNQKYHDLKSKKTIEMKLIYQELHSIAGNIYLRREIREQGNFYLEIAHISLNDDDQPFLKAIKNRLESSEELFKKSKFYEALNLLEIIDKEQIYDDDLRHKVIIALAQVYLKLKNKKQAIFHCDMLPPGIFEDKVKQVREEAKSKGISQYVKQFQGF